MFAALLMTGCSTGASVENLLTPPKLNAQQDEIYQALINSTGAAINLKYPKSGDYRSAFVIRSIDSEPGEEALVFYEPDSVQSGEAALRLKVLDQYDGKWQAVYDLACFGSEVESVSFTGIGAGNQTDIIIRYTMLNQTEKAFSLINYSDGIPNELYAASYSCLEVIDLNGDGATELVTVSADKATGSYNAAMFSRTDDGLEKLSETPLAGTHSEIVKVSKGMLAEDVPALFIDFLRGQGQYGTDVIYCHGDEIFSPDSIGPSAESSIISRFTNDYTAEIYCYDIDGDGFNEIPSMTPLPGYELLTRSEQLCAVRWYTVKYKNFSLEHYGYYSSKYGFALLFPHRWYGVVTAVPNLQENEIIFISYNPVKGLTVDPSTELMRIRIVDKNDKTAAEKVEGMTVLLENEESIYCYSETDGYKTGKLALTESELKNSFILF